MKLAQSGSAGYLVFHVVVDRERTGRQQEELQYLQLYFSIPTRHFQLVLDDSEDVFTISHIVGSHGRVVSALDLHVGARIHLLGRWTTLMQPSLLTRQWLDLHEKQFTVIKRELETALLKYDLRSGLNRKPMAGSMNQRMASAQRKIALLVDSAPLHFPIELSHIKLVRLPPKGLHRSQPFEAGVMKTFKALYRKSHLSFAVDQAEEGRTRIFDVSLTRALHWVKQAWLDVSADLIRNCWARTGLFTTRDQILTTEAADIHPEVVQSLVVSLSQLQLLETVPIETLLNPRNEDDAHYVYDDTTVLRVVTGSLADDEEGARMEIVHAAAPVCDPSAGAVSTQREEERVVDTPPSVEELLANYRGVIWSLDADPNRSEEAPSVLRFLRRKQATLRLQHQQQQTDLRQQTPVSMPLNLSVGTGTSQAERVSMM